MSQTYASPVYDRSGLLPLIEEQLLFSGSRVVPTQLIGFMHHRWPVGSYKTVSGVNTSTDQLTLNASVAGFGDRTDCRIFLTSTGAVPSPLVSGAEGWVIPVDSTHVKVAPTEAGSPVDLTDVGSGTITAEFRSRTPTARYGNFRSHDSGIGAMYGLFQFGTTLSGGASGGASSLALTNTSTLSPAATQFTFAQGDLVIVKLDSGALYYGTVGATPSATAINISPNLPSAAGAGKRVYRVDPVSIVTFDTYMDSHYALGHKITWTAYGMPCFLSSSQGANDAYGRNGGRGPCSDYAAWEDLVTAVVTRANTDTWRNNGGVKKLYAIEGWNEPAYAQNNTGYWNGTAANLAEQQRHTYAAAKAVDSTIMVICPGFGGGEPFTQFGPGPGSLISNMYAYLIASDGASGTGKDWTEALAIHPYEFTANLPRHWIGLTNWMRSCAAAAGMANAATIPLYANEVGLSNSLSTTDPDRGLLLARTCVLVGVLGWESITFDDYDGALMNWIQSDPRLLDGINLAHDTLAGKTLLRAAFVNGNRLAITTAERGLTII